MSYNNNPPLINWSITNRCNLHCKFCYKFFDDDPTYEEKRYILNKIIDSNVTRITFTGGEPLLDDNLIDILKICNENSIFTSIHTNGTIERNFYTIIKFANRISLPLDGPDERINFLMRNSGIFYSKVIKKLEFLYNNNYEFSIKTVVTKINKDYIFSMIPIINKYKPSFWSLFQFRPIREGDLNKSKFSISEVEFYKVINKLQGNVNVKLNVLSAKNASSYPIFLISGKGKVYTNNLSGDILIGSLYKNSIQELWKKILRINPIKDIYLSKYKIIKNIRYK